MRFLIDECLSIELVGVAYESGFEAYHVAHRGWSGWTDAEIARRMVDDDLILVTNNREDYLGLIGSSGIHPGLIVIVPSVRRHEQIRLFKRALAHASSLDSMINQVIEVQADGSISVYELPPLEQ